ncbi:MAG: MoaD/ThiS family protein [Bacillota bacterium]
MRIVVVLAGALRDYVSNGVDRMEVELPEGATVRELIGALGLQLELVMAVVAGGEKRGKDYRLTAGEEITLIPPVSGG